MVQLVAYVNFCKTTCKAQLGSPKTCDLGANYRYRANISQNTTLLYFSLSRVNAQIDWLSIGAAMFATPARPHLDFRPHLIE
jgi:hypothetical protein